MSNIVTFKPRKSAPKVELPTNQAPQEALDYIAGLYEWADERGIDTTTLDFKYEAATIMTVVQGMLSKNV